MEKENRTEKENKKITAFRFQEDIAENESVDQLLKESLMQEADELEELLNKDPAMAGVGASDDLFDSIVAKLKEEGAWKEETSEKDLERKVTTDQEEKEPDDLGYIYEKLSKEDREALELGRRMNRERQAKQEKKQHRRRVYQRLFRHASVAAAVLITVFGLSMTSEANRKTALKFWNGLMENLDFRSYTDLVSEEESVRSKSKEEMEAMKEISSVLDIGGIDFVYLPKGTKYLDYEVIGDFAWEAILMYSYQENILSVKVTKIEKEGVSYNYVNGETDLQETFINQQGQRVKVWKTNLDITEESYMAELQKDGVRYVINGMIPYNEFKKILECVYIL